MIFSFLLGLSIGSFLNALEYRLDKKGLNMMQRSMCPKCKHVLSWKDLIPLFSFLFLKGRCRYCKKKISWQYPIIEFLTGSLFVITGIYFLDFFDFYSVSAVFIYFGLTFLFSCLLSIFLFIGLYDLKHEIVPDKVTIPLIVLLLVLSTSGLILKLAHVELWQRIIDFQGITLIRNFEFVPFSNSVYSLLAGIVGGLFFVAIIVISKGKGMGGGDIRLGILMGLLLGLKGLFVSLYIAFIVGAVAGIMYAVKKKKLKGLIIPFAPFLSLGTIVSFFLFNYIWDFLFPFSFSSLS